MKRLACIAALLIACGSKSSDPVEPASGSGSDGSGAPAAGKGACVVGGCSGSVCTEPGNDMMTTCEMKPEYACYQDAKCEVQANGRCGWTTDAPLEKCLASPPPL